jgi:hypothetical protein
MAKGGEPLWGFHEPVVDLVTCSRLAEPCSSRTLSIQGPMICDTDGTPHSARQDVTF